MKSKMHKQDKKSKNKNSRQENHMETLTQNRKKNKIIKSKILRDREKNSNILLENKKINNQGKTSIRIKLLKQKRVRYSAKITENQK